MGILRYGADANGLAFENPFVTPWYRAGDGGIAGLWLNPLRENRPANWDKAGYVHLVTRTNPNQVNFRIESAIALLNRNHLFLLPASLQGNEFRLELELVDWVTLVSVDYGTVLLEPEEENNLESVLDTLQVLVAVVQALL